MYCGVPGPFCSFVLLLRGWPGDLHAGSCYGPGYCSAPEPGSQHPVMQYEMLNMKPPSWGIPALPAAVMPPEHQCMPSCYSSNNQMKAVADIHRYRYKYMWHVYVYIYIWYTYTFRMEHCEQFHCHLRDPKGILCAGQVAVGIVPQLLLLDLPPLARPLPRRQHLPTHRPPLHSASKEFAEARRQRIIFLSNM